MGKITVQEYTTKNPLELMGRESGECWGSDTSDAAKNAKRGRENLQTGHMRVAEYPQVYLKLEGYSARVIRELYTHIAGGPTRLQASTRYIGYNEFTFVTPPKIARNPEAKKLYEEEMANINRTRLAMQSIGISREDTANLLPLGMTTTVILRTNLRNLIDMAHQRMCSRAYWEFRDLMFDIGFSLSGYSDEWSEIVDKYFKPKCVVCGFCEEKFSCGRMPQKPTI